MREIIIPKKVTKLLSLLKEREATWGYPYASPEDRAQRENKRDRLLTEMKAQPEYDDFKKFKNYISLAEAFAPDFGRSHKYVMEE